MLPLCTLQRDDSVAILGAGAGGNQEIITATVDHTRAAYTALQSVDLARELGGQSEAAGNIVKESSGREDTMTKLQALNRAGEGG